VQLQRPERIFAVVGLLIAGGALWLLVDRPRDSGVRLSGVVEYCTTRGPHQTLPTWCRIWISGENRAVQVYLRNEFPGHRVRLIEMRRTVTRRRYYAVDYTGKL
jgi:hypothetical protein